MNKRSIIAAQGRVMVVAICLFVVSGCASTDFKSAFGSVNLLSPTSPDYTFVVEEKNIQGTTKNALGTAYLQSHGYDMPVHNCIAQGLIGKFPNARIILGSSAASGQVKIGNYRDFTVQQGWVMPAKCSFTVDVTVSGQTRSFEADAGAGFLYGFPSEDAAKNACDGLAGDIKEYLQSGSSSQTSLRQ